MLCSDYTAVGNTISTSIRQSMLVCFFKDIISFGEKTQTTSHLSACPSIKHVTMTIFEICMSEEIDSNSASQSVS